LLHTPEKNENKKLLNLRLIRMNEIEQHRAVYNSKKYVARKWNEKKEKSVLLTAKKII
jgi:hypothetical protein